MAMTRLYRFYTFCFLFLTIDIISSAHSERKSESEQDADKETKLEKDVLIKYLLKKYELSDILTATEKSGNEVDTKLAQHQNHVHEITKDATEIGKLVNLLKEAIKVSRKELQMNIELVKKMGDVINAIKDAKSITFIEGEETSTKSSTVASGGAKYKGYSDVAAQKLRIKLLARALHLLSGRSSI